MAECSGGRCGRTGWVAGLSLALICLLFVSACGFKLRGARVADGHHLPVIYIRSERGSQLSVELHRIFHQAGLRVADSRDQAVWVLTLSDEQRDRRVLSVNRSGKAQEYELHYRVYYILQDDSGREIIARQELTLLRDVSFSSSDVLAKADEETLLYQGMQQQVAQMILRRLLLQQGKDVVVDQPEAAAVP